MNDKLFEDLKEKFTIIDIDFNEEGDKKYFLFYANEFSEDKANELYGDYDEKYSNDQYDGAFEEYLQELEIKYYILN